MANPTLYTLRAVDVDVALMCVGMTDAMMQQKDTKKTALLTGDHQKGFKRLMKELMSMRDEGGESAPRDLELDAYMTFALMHSIVQSFYRMKGHLLLPKNERKPISDEAEAEIENMYNALKEPAADLLWELTPLWNYSDYCLQTLEEVFDRKPAARPLKVDDTEIVFEVTINEHNSHLFSWVFSNFELLKGYRDKYEFAAQFWGCQYVNLSDYEALKKKLHQKPEGHKIPMALRDVIVLYYVLSLAGKLFVTDAADLYTELGQTTTKKLSKEAVLKTRNFFLKFNDELIGLLKKSFSGNKRFMLEIERVKNW